MNKNLFIPQPADTAEVKLSERLKELSELIAENVHNVWAAGRMAEGWTYGEQRDEQKKQHPCLIPYDMLSENEKSYDRNTAIETLKLIIKLGFKII